MEDMSAMTYEDDSGQGYGEGLRSGQRLVGCIAILGKEVHGLGSGSGSGLGIRIRLRVGLGVGLGFGSGVAVQPW